MRRVSGIERMCRVGIVMAGALWVGRDAMAAGTGSLAGLDGYIERARADWKNVGLAVAVVQGTKVVYARGFGVRETGLPAAVDRDTRFQVGSTSKAFTATALGLLVDEGRVRWDDPLARYLPELQLPDAELTRNVTLRDALAHRSGIVEPIYFALDVMSADQALQQLKFARVDGNFRESYNYSNLMYEAAAKVVEVASGMSWREFVTQRLLGPLKMRGSGTSPYEFWDASDVAPTFLGEPPAGVPHVQKARATNLAMPHALDEHGRVQRLPWQSYDDAAGAGAIVSSAADMANWLILHLNEGRYDGRALVSRETMEAMHATQNTHVQVSRPAPGETVQAYAMGWRRDEFRGQTILTHGGGIIGFPAYVAILPARKTGVVVLSNGAAFTQDRYGLHKSIVFRVFDRALGIPDRDWNQEILGYVQTLQHEAQASEDGRRRTRRSDLSALSLEQYAGSYEDATAQSGRVSLRVHEGKLILSFAAPGAFSAPLEPWHRDLFRLRPAPGVADALGPQFIDFALGPSGKVATMSAFRGTFQRVAD